MRGPKPPPIDLAAAERHELERLVRRHSTPQQLAVRAQIVLAAAERANNCQIARQLDVSLDMVRRWRERWLACQAASLEDLSVAERLTDAPRPGTPVRITDEQVTRIVALACEPPANADVPATPAVRPIPNVSAGSAQRRAPRGPAGAGLCATPRPGRALGRARCHTSASAAPNRSPKSWR